MDLESDLLSRRSFSRVVRLFGVACRLPFWFVISVLEWLVTDVLSRLLALPWLLVTEVKGQVERARLRRDYRLLLQGDALELQRTQTAVERPFREILHAIDRLDREHARLDPHFEESLVAAQETYRQYLLALTSLARERWPTTSAQSGNLPNQY